MFSEFTMVSHSGIFFESITLHSSIIRPDDSKEESRGNVESIGIFFEFSDISDLKNFSLS